MESDESPPFFLIPHRRHGILWLYFTINSIIMDPIQGTTPPSNPSVTPATSKSKSPIILAVIGVIASVGVLGSLFSKKTDEPKTPGVNNAPQPSEREEVNEVETIPASPSAKQAPADIPSGQSYKDGSYESDGSYQSPAGPEKVHLAVTLKNGVVTDTSFSGISETPKSQMYMNNFNKNYKTLVIGKKIDEIKITQLSGSSLTPMGFSDALAKIAAQAKM